MAKPWNMEFNENSLHESLQKAIKALSDWLILPDNDKRDFVVKVEIGKKE